MDPVKKILVIDDEINLTKTLVAILENQGYRAIGKLNGDSALQDLQISNYDLILLDMVMPGIGGLDLLTKIRSINPEVPILIFAANPTPEMTTRTRQLGAQGYILKPIDPVGLIQRIQSTLNNNHKEMN